MTDTAVGTGLHPMFVKVPGTGVAFGWNFGARYFWIFGR